MIVIPMAGLSSRFYLAGFTQPKYMLEAHGKSLLVHALLSFKRYFQSETFLFIIRDVQKTSAFVEDNVKRLGIVNAQVVVIEGETRGQADTVARGLSETDYDGALTIFNIDTFRPDFVSPDLSALDEGYLEVFLGAGDHWSFVEPVSKETTRIGRTTEKVPISDYCCTGLYHFKRSEDFLAAFNYYESLPQEKWDKGELYVAPLYNYLIAQGKSIHYHLIDTKDVIFCGTPDEYADFQAADAYI